MTNTYDTSDALKKSMLALEAYFILDTPPEEGFDDVTLIASQVCNTPVSLISFVTFERQWFKSTVGFDGCETPLNESVCQFAMHSPGLFVIPDLSQDERTKNNPLVTGGPQIRFYAGAPLRDTHGVPIGSLCVIDTQPRPEGLTQQQGDALMALGRQVMAQLEARRVMMAQAQSKDAEHAVTALKLAEAQRIGQLREHFVAVLGHDLRNPLGAIASGLNLLSRENFSQRGGLITAMMEQSVTRMTELIDSTLDFARTRMGSGLSVRLDAEAPLQPVLEQAINELWVKWPARKINATFEIAQPVACDRARIAQLFSNLLANAFAHGDPTRPIVVEAVTSPKAFSLSVANGGTPIPQAQIAKLFEPFSQGKDSSANGLGLGLYIASEIAKSHGGTLKATSTEAQTRFVFEMPIKNDLAQN